MRYGHIEQSLKQQRKARPRLAVDCILIVEMEVRKTTRKPAYSRPASIFCHQIDPGRASKQHTARCNVDREGPAKRARTLRALQQRFQKLNEYCDETVAELRASLERAPPR